MIRQRTVSAEEEYAAKVMNDGITAEDGTTTGLQDLLNFKAEDAPIDTESDDEVLGINFNEEEPSSSDTVTIIRNATDAVKK